MSNHPAEETVNLFYLDAPARPGDTLYTQWLNMARRSQAELLITILMNDNVVAAGDTSQMSCNLESINQLLRNRYKSDDSQTRAIYANPENVRYRRLMQTVVDQSIGLCSQ